MRKILDYFNTPKQKIRYANAIEKDGLGEYYFKCWSYWSQIQIDTYREKE